MAFLKYPERLLQPFQTLTRFQQELYAMFRAAGDDARVDAVPGGPEEVPEKAVRSRRDAAKGRDRDVLPTRAESPPARPTPETSTPRRVANDAPAPRVEVRRAPASPIEERRIAAATAPSLPERQRRPRRPYAAPGTREGRDVPEAPETREKRPQSPPPGRRDDARDLRREAGREVPEIPAPRRSDSTVDDSAFPESEFPSPEIPPFEINVPGDGGGTTVFMGRVVSHTSGAPASVNLYPDGPEADPDPDGPFDVTIPTLADDEALPPEMWLNAVFQFTDADGNPTYSSQPPVWLD